MTNLSKCIIKVSLSKSLQFAVSTLLVPQVPAQSNRHIPAIKLCSCLSVHAVTFCSTPQSSQGHSCDFPDNTGEEDGEPSSTNKIRGYFTAFSQPQAVLCTKYHQSRKIMKDKIKGSFSKGKSQKCSNGRTGEMVNLGDLD